MADTNNEFKSNLILGRQKTAGASR